MIQLKIVIIVLFVVCSSSACSTVSSLPTQANSSKEDLASNTKQTVENVEQDANAVRRFESDANTNPNHISIDEKIKRPRQAQARRKTIQFPDDCDYLVSSGNENWLQAACADAIREVQPSLPKENCGYVNFKDAYGKDGYYDLNAYNDPSHHPSAVQFYPLSPNKYLVQIYCNSGAYNTENVYLLYDESTIPAKAEILEFPWIKPESHIFDDFSDLDPPSDNYIAKRVKIVNVKIIGGINFNPKTKKLIVYTRGNGIGEFGQYARYSFPNDKTKLEEFRAKYYYSKNSPAYSPDDMIKHPPKTWKRYYPK